MNSLEKLHEKVGFYQVIKNYGWIQIGQKWHADAWADWRCEGLEGSGEMGMLFHWIWGFPLLEIMLRIQIKVSCQKATSGWLEESIFDDILISGKMKEKILAGDNILFEKKKKT